MPIHQVTFEAHLEIDHGHVSLSVGVSAEVKTDVPRHGEVKGEVSYETSYEVEGYHPQINPATLEAILLTGAVVAGIATRGFVPSVPPEGDSAPVLG